MPTCHWCQALYISGEILCPQCGADLDEPAASAESSPSQHLLVVDVIPTIALHLIEVDDLKFPEGRMSVTIPVARLETPVRIGRSDRNQVPPIHPELCLGGILADLQFGVRPVVSRLHAALQLDSGRPTIKAVADLNGTTWIRHTGDNRFSPVPPNAVRPLENRDVIVLGHPKGRHVSLRVVLSHP